MIGNHLSRFCRIVFGAAFGLILFGYDRGNAQDEGAIASGERPQLEAAIKVANWLVVMQNQAKAAGVFHDES